MDFNKKIYYILFTCLIGCVGIPFLSQSQPIDITSIYSKKTLQAERLKQQQGLYKYSLLPLLKIQPDSTNEYSFESALGAISQFMIKNDTTKQIVDKLVAHYANLNSDTRRALLEVIYSLYIKKYDAQLRPYWETEPNIKLWAMLTLILKKGNVAFLKMPIDSIAFANRIADTSHPIIDELLKNKIITGKKEKALRPLLELFANQKTVGTKIIYSLQRTDRNYAGLAIVQNADGSFVKDKDGSVKTFVQLARSASNLPYFITDGSTPQGIFRIDSIAVSTNQAIGPTPNIQLRMPNEIVGDSFFIRANQPILNDTIYLEAYNNLLPKTWRTNEMQQSFFAGKCGRSEIIAHGSTIDPSYYQHNPFYPNTPTMGCLCAKENWDFRTGKLLQSDQLDLVNAFLSTPGASGYLMVIDVDAQQKAVTKLEVENWVKQYEK